MDARMKWMSSVLGAAAMLVAIGTGSVFAAEPDFPMADDPTVEVTEAPVVEVDEPIVVIDDPVETKDHPGIVTLENDVDDVTEPAENPGEGAGDDEACELEADTPLDSEPASDRSSASRFEFPTGEVPVLFECADLTDATDAADPTDANVADEAEDADPVPGSDGTEVALPATDTAPEPSQVQIDPRTAALIALVLVAVAWSGTQAREDSPTR